MSLLAGLGFTFLGLSSLFQAIRLKSIETDIKATQNEVAEMHAELFQLNDILNPAPVDVQEYADDTEADKQQQIAELHEIEANIAMMERVSNMKKELDSMQTRVHSPSLPPSFHPDVYNIPNAHIPDTSHTVEYVE